MHEEVKVAIRKSIPFLQSNGERLTSRMYQVLFEENPEFRSMFEGDNSKKLASTLLAVALNLDKLDVLKTAINAIALSHVKAGVKPEYYSKVWNALSQAMFELGVSQDIVDAWKDVYWFLADVLIDKEKRLYTCLE